jgi:hypothetical protein
MREAGGELDRGLVAELPKRGVVLEPSHLPGAGVGELAAPVPDRADPQATGRVDVLVALGVPEAGTLAAHEHDRLGRMADHLVRVKDVAAIEVPQARRRLRGVAHSAIFTVLIAVYSPIDSGPSS